MSVFSRSTSGNGGAQAQRRRQRRLEAGAAAAATEVKGERPADNVKAERDPGDTPIVNAAQPTEPLTSDGTLPIEIVGPEQRHRGPGGR